MYPCLAFVVDHAANAWLAAPGGTTSALSSDGQPRSWRPFGELNHYLRALDGAVPLSDLTLQTEASLTPCMRLHTSRTPNDC
jgi:hypothetical protein